MERVIGKGTSSNGFAKRRMIRVVGGSDDTDGIGGTMVIFGTTSLLVLVSVSVDSRSIEKPPRNEPGDTPQPELGIRSFRFRPNKNGTACGTPPDTLEAERSPCGDECGAGVRLSRLRESLFDRKD
jgi:hypothetical protein